MRDELMNKLLCLVQSYDVPIDDLQSKMYLILSEYEIESRHTEVAVCNEDDITKYVRLFLISKRVSGRTERTLGAYKNGLRNFFEEVQKSPLDVTSDDIKMFIAMKEVRDGVSKYYQNHLLRILGSFYTWMQREEYLSQNPMNKVDSIKLPKTKKKAFTETDIEKIRLQVEGDDRLACIVEILLSTWCRISELCNMKISEISESGESVLIHGKGSKDRICYLNAKAQLYIKRYLGRRKDENEYLFPKSSKGLGIFSKSCKEFSVKPKDWWTCKELVDEHDHVDQGSIESNLRNLGKRAGVDNVHPHRFRRTGATLALRRGMPIEQVSKLLGHESLETTQIYLDISEKELEQSHKKYV